MLSGKKRAVLFDLDGTLLDTIEDLAACMNAAVKAAGLPTTPVGEHKRMVGDGVANYVQRALPEDRRGDKKLIDRVTAEYRGLYHKHWADYTRPYDGVEELLDALTARGVVLAVLSNKPDPFTREMVRYFFPAVPFAAVEGAKDGSPLKPDPGAALVIAREVKIPPAEFAYVGDTNTDMQTARAAGMLAVGALWGFRSREELEAAGAEVLIARPMELVEVAAF
jgi:phosphoglycolate phosphatase